MAIEMGDRALATDNEGYLLDPSEWSEDVAQEIARREELPLDADRWTVVRFVREYFESRQSVPEARFALKAMREQLGQDKATRKYLYQLFDAMPDTNGVLMPIHELAGLPAVRLETDEGFGTAF